MNSYTMYATKGKVFFRPYDMQLFGNEVTLFSNASTHVNPDDLPSDFIEVFDPENVPDMDWSIENMRQYMRDWGIEFEPQNTQWELFLRLPNLKTRVSKVLDF